MSVVDVVKRATAVLAGAVDAREVWTSVPDTNPVNGPAVAVLLRDVAPRYGETYGTVDSRDDILEGPYLMYNGTMHVMYGSQFQPHEIFWTQLADCERIVRAFAADVQLRIGTGEKVCEKFELIAVMPEVRPIDTVPYFGIRVEWRAGEWI